MAASVIPFPRHYGPKAPRHVARRVKYRRPKAEVVTFTVTPTNAKRRAFALYSEASLLDDTDPAAATIYERALQLDPTLALAHTNLGNCRYHQKRVDDAVACYERAIEIDPEQPEALYNLGYILMERGDLDGAIPLLEAAVKVDPEFADAWFNLGVAYTKRLGTNRCPAVQRCFVRYLRYDSTGEWAAAARRNIAT